MARTILNLKFDDSAKARMHELLERNRNGSLTPDESREMEEYSSVGNLLGILQSKARMKLKSLGRPYLDDDTVR